MHRKLCLLGPGILLITNNISLFLADGQDIETEDNDDIVYVIQRSNAPTHTYIYMSSPRTCKRER